MEQEEVWDGTTVLLLSLVARNAWQVSRDMTYTGGSAVDEHLRGRRGEAEARARLVKPCAVREE